MLYNKLKNYTLSDAINFEEQDRQFLALKKLYKNKIMSDSNYLFLIIVNSLICYQLSGKGEDYWKEFSEILEKKDFNNFSEIYIFFENFLPDSKNNKRFIKTKLKRAKKLENIYRYFLEKNEYFYNNMENLIIFLAKTMNQKVDAKTIVFAVKMFSYGARNIFGFKDFSKNINIPIDSRLEKLFYKFKGGTQGSPLQEIKSFYQKLSDKLNIPLLHLDAILWVNYDELIK